MEEEDIILNEQDRAKLDDIVKRMEANKEPEEDIKFVVEDFKKKYGTIEPIKKKVQLAPTDVDSPLPLAPSTSSLDSLSQSDPGVITEQDLFSDTDGTEPKKQGLTFLEKHFGWVKDYGVTGVDPSIIRMGRRVRTGIDPTKDDISPIEETAIALETGIKQLTSGLMSLPNLLDKTKDRITNPILDTVAGWISGGDTKVKEQFKQVIKKEIDAVNPLTIIAKESNKVQRDLQDLTAYTQSQQQSYNDGIIESFKKGKISDGFQQISNAIVTTAPNTALILGTGGTGLVVSGASSAGSRLSELEREQELTGKEYDPDKVLLNAYAYGSLDFASNLVLRGLGKANKQLFKELGRETIEENVKQSFKNVLLNTGAEGLEEMLTQLGQNSADILLLDSDKDLMDNVLEAGVIGLSNAGVISSPAITAYATNTLMSKRERAKIDKADSAIRGILKSLATTTDAETIEILGRLLQENKNTILDTFKKGNETIENLPDNLKEIVTKNVAEMASIKMEIDNPASVESLDQLQQRFNELKQNSLLRINNQANQTKLNSLPDRGLKLKEQAAKELMQEFIDRGETEFNISDEQINNKAIEILTKQTQEQDAELSDKEKVEDATQQIKKEDVRSKEDETLQKEEVARQQPKTLESLPDRGLELKEEARRQLVEESKEGGLENFSISDREVTKRANKLLQEETEASAKEVSDLLKSDAAKDLNLSDFDIESEVSKLTSAKLKNQTDFNNLIKNVKMPVSELKGPLKTIKKSSLVQPLFDFFRGTGVKPAKEELSQLRNQKLSALVEKFGTSVIKLDKDATSKLIPYLEQYYDDVFSKIEEGPLKTIYENDKSTLIDDSVDSLLDTYAGIRGVAGNSNSIILNMPNIESDDYRRVLEHELAHIFTATYLRDEAEYNLQDSYSLEDFTPTELDFRNTVIDAYNRVVTDDKVKDSFYGYTNPSEFVVEYIANKKFQADVDSRLKGENFFDKIKNFFKKLFGIELDKNKYIENLEKSIDKLFDEQIQYDEIELRGQELLDIKKETRKSLRSYVKGIPVITQLDKVIFEDNIAKPLENFVSKKVKQGLQSRNKISRTVAQTATNWFNGLPRDREDLIQKRQLTGKQNLAFVEGEALTKNLQQFVNADKESLRRVHAVLDPELYADEDISNISLEDLTDNERALADNLRDLNNKIHQFNFDLGFIDKETYDKFKDSYIGREYDVFVEEALDISQEYFPQSKIFDKIFKQRKEIDQWKIDHKIEDPIYLTVSRLMQTERNAAVLSYSQYINDQVGTVRDYATQEEARADGYTILNGKAYGELNGKAVPNYIAEDFKGYFFANEMMDKLYDVVTIYDKSAARQFLKRYHTVYSPVVQLGNLLSNQAFAFTSGVNAVELWAEVGNANASLKNKDNDYKKLVLNNIIGANILKQDLAPMSKQLEVFQTKEEVKSIKDKVSRGFKKLDDKARDLYSKSDDLMKLAAFKALKKQGLNDTDAIERVFEGFQNYSTVGKVWDMSSKVPVFGNAYIKFQADLQRIVKNAVIKRPLTTASFLGALKLMALMASEASEESEEARDIRESRPFIPKINLGAFDIPLVTKVGDKEVNLARFISPYYNYDIPNETWLEKLSAMTPFQLEQFETQAGQKAIGFKAPDVLLGSFYSAFVSNRDFRGKAITDPYASKYKESGLSEEEKFFNRLTYVSRSIVPLYSTADDLYKAQMYGEDTYGRDKTVLDIIASKIVKIQTFDDKSLKKQILSNIKTINYNSKSINTKILNIRRKLGRDMLELEKRKKEGKITQEQYDNKFKKESDQSKKRINKQLELLVKEQEKLNNLINKINSNPELKRVVDSK